MRRLKGQLLQPALSANLKHLALNNRSHPDKVAGSRVRGSDNRARDKEIKVDKTSRVACGIRVPSRMNKAEPMKMISRGRNF